MKILSLKNIATFFVILMLTGCQTFRVPYQPCMPQDQSVVSALTPIEVEILENRVGDGLHLQKVDNLIILFDDSINLLECQGYFTKRQRALSLLDRISATLSETTLNKGIRVFGPHADHTNFKNTTVYGMASTESQTIKPTVITKTPKDPMINPLAMALYSTYHELKYVKGNTAVFILSDFEGVDNDVYSAVDMINDFYGTRVCLYGIYLGEDTQYRDFLSKIIGMDTCGFFTKETGMEKPPQLTDFLENVIYQIVPAAGSSKDLSSRDVGADSIIPLIPQETFQTASEEMTDTKKDQIRESESTPVPPELSYKKLEVEKELRVELKTEFDFGKSVIRPEYIEHLKVIADFMNKYQDTKTVIEGRTCSIGTEEFNMKLSYERADSIRKYLVEELGVDSKRLDIKAYGETRPIADNNTEEGRKRNRRAEAVIVAIVVEEVKQTTP